MHGCGKKWYPGGALEEVRTWLLPGDTTEGRLTTQWQGEWIEDNFVGDFGACDAAAALAAVQSAERVAADARDFMYKPDGGAS
jgi:hypothetical protein